MSETDTEELDMNYELTYDHISKEKSYKGQLHQVIVGSTILESQIAQLMETATGTLPSEVVRQWSQLTKAPISQKTKALQVAGIINDDLCHNLGIAFSIRNQFAHQVAIPPNAIESAFQRLKGVRIPNDFVRNLPNDAAKFCLVVSHCFHELMGISKKLDPGSVLQLDHVKDMTPIEE